MDTGKDESEALTPQAQLLPDPSDSAAVATRTQTPSGRSGTPSTPLVEIVVTEELSGRASVRLQDLLSEALTLRPAQIVVDLAACGALDATALDVLLETHRRMWSSGGRLTLRSPSARLRRILTLARVDNVFHITQGRSGARPPDRRDRALVSHPGPEHP